MTKRIKDLLAAFGKAAAKALKTAFDDTVADRDPSIRYQTGVLTFENGRRLTVSIPMRASDFAA